MDEGEQMKRKMLNRQMKKVTLKFWNNMIVFLCMVVVVVGSVSAAEPQQSSQNSGNSNTAFYDAVRASLTEETAIQAYTALSIAEPKATIKSVNRASLTANADYEIQASYTISTKHGVATVSVTSQVNADTGDITVLNKRMVRSSEEFSETDKELFVLYNNDITAISVENKEYAHKLLIDAVQPLVEKSTVKSPSLSTEKKFVVMVKKTPSFTYEQEVVSTENYKFYVVRTNDISPFLQNQNVIKICEANRIRLKNFVQYAKDVLSAEATEIIGELKLRKSSSDCVELPELKQYMEGEGWYSTDEGSPYQRFVTPDDPAIKELAQGKTLKELYAIAVDWTWVPDSVLHGKAEKWLFPAEFLGDTPGYATNPVKGSPVSDCSEQANTFASLVRASGVAPEDVRVGIGTVDFGGSDGPSGHAWVEKKIDGQWIVFDSTCGDYYDVETGDIVYRNGVPYDYWQYHPYPIAGEGVWYYYNDELSSDENQNIPDGWAEEYNAEENLLAGFAFLSEESIDFLFLYMIIASVAVICGVLLYRVKQERSNKK